MASSLRFTVVLLKGAGWLTDANEDKAPEADAASGIRCFEAYLAGERGKQVMCCLAVSLLFGIFLGKRELARCFFNLSSWIVINSDFFFFLSRGNRKRSLNGC
jgi:hypothetical protein